jgi:putative MFS transporter
MKTSGSGAGSIAITFHHPIAFWTGTIAIASGVILHVPHYLMSGSMGYRLVGMGLNGPMLFGMVLILVGLALAAYGLIPRGAMAVPTPRRLTDVHIHAMDRARLSPTHWGMLFVLGVALVVDVMKPATLGFVVPGMKLEYDLNPAQIALLPTAALTGTTFGSILWGSLADRIGRRAAIMLASLIFMGTSICGFMPAFGWNLFMCFIMGTSAGGMLPIVYALMAESIPARMRGWLVVLYGGLGTVGGFLVASGLAALLEPQFAWRILWFAGLPTGLVVLLLNLWIPESPRFLLEHGRVGEAEAVMARFGVVMERVAHSADSPEIAPIVSRGKSGACAVVGCRRSSGTRTSRTR